MHQTRLVVGNPICRKARGIRSLIKLDRAPKKHYIAMFDLHTFCSLPPHEAMTPHCNESAHTSFVLSHHMHSHIHTRFPRIRLVAFKYCSPTKQKNHSKSSGPHRYTWFPNMLSRTPHNVSPWRVRKRIDKIRYPE